MLSKFKQIYKEHEKYLTKSFDDYIRDVESYFIRTITANAYCNKILNHFKVKYPDIIWKIQGSGCCDVVLSGYNVPKENIKEIKRYFYDLQDVENPNYEFDLGISLKDTETTLEHYSSKLNKESNEKR